MIQKGLIQALTILFAVVPGRALPSVAALITVQMDTTPPAVSTILASALSEQNSLNRDFQDLRIAGILNKITASRQSFIIL
jgi:hypothetical protein